MSTRKIEQTAYQTSTFGSRKELGRGVDGRVALGKLLRSLKRAGTKLFRYRKPSMPHFFRCVVGAEFVTLWIEPEMARTPAQCGKEDA